MHSLVYFTFLSSHPPLRRLGNGIFKCIPLSELVIIMFGLVPLIKIEVVFGKEMIVILWANKFIWVGILAFIGVEKSSFVLPQFVVIIFVIEVFVGLWGSFIGCGSEVIDYLLKACLFGFFHDRLLNRSDVNIESAQLIINIVHSLLDVGLFSIGWEVKRFERREGTKQLFKGDWLCMFGFDFPTQPLILLDRELHTMFMNEPN